MRPSCYELPSDVFYPRFRCCPFVIPPSHVWSHSLGLLANFHGEFASPSSVVSSAAPEYDNEFGAADSVNPFCSLSYSANHHSATLYRETIPLVESKVLQFLDQLFVALWPVCAQPAPRAPLVELFFDFFQQSACFCYVSSIESDF